MAISQKDRLMWFGVIIIGLAVASPALAQRYRYPRRGYPVIPGGIVIAPYAGPGGVLAGQADVINAQGEFMKQQEEARFGREKAFQEYLNSKKQAIELNKYIESITPTYGETREKNKGMLTRRILNDPTPAEISSGKSLNVTLAFLQDLGKQGVMGPPVTLDPSIINKINVSSPTDKGNVGMLRNGGNVDWPLALRGRDLQVKLDKELPAAVTAAANGTITFSQYQNVRKDVIKLRDDTTALYAKHKLDAASYLLADDFLEQLGLAVFELQKPGAKHVLSGAYKAVGRNVQELVYNMTKQGLQFSPSAPGNETAYYSLQSSLSQYAIGTQHNFGFSPQTVAPRKNFTYPKQ